MLFDFRSGKALAAPLFFVCVSLCVTDTTAAAASNGPAASYAFVPLGIPSLDPPEVGTFFGSVVEFVPGGAAMAVDPAGRAAGWGGIDARLPFPGPPHVPSNWTAVAWGKPSTSEPSVITVEDGMLSSGTTFPRAGVAFDINGRGEIVGSGQNGMSRFGMPGWAMPSIDASTLNVQRKTNPAPPLKWFLNPDGTVSTAGPLSISATPGVSGSIASPLSANAINEHGAAVGVSGSGSTHADSLAVYWPAGATEGQFLPGVEGIIVTSGSGGAYDINDQGQIAGQVRAYGQDHPAVWPAHDQEPIRLGRQLPGGTAIEVYALGINNRGDTLGIAFYFDDDSASGFRQRVVYWPEHELRAEPRGFSPIADWAEINQEEYFGGLNNHGLAVGAANLREYLDGQEWHAVLWDMNQEAGHESIAPVDLHELTDEGTLPEGGVVAYASDINDAGVISVMLTIGAEPSPHGGFRMEGRVPGLLVPISEISGDFNNSGAVEQADLDAVLGHWGQPRPGSWVNDSGMTAEVDQDELDAVLGNWGLSSRPASGESVVPEPGLGLLGSVGMLSLWRRRGRELGR